MLNYILHLPLFLLSYITPKKSNLIVLGAGDAKQFQGNPKYLFLHLKNLEHSTVEYYWSAKSKKQIEFLEENNFPYIKTYSLKGFFKILRAKYLIIEKSSFDVYYIKSVRGRFNFVQTWHGSPFKKVGIHAADHLKGSVQFSTKRNSLVYRFLVKVKFFSRNKYKYITAPSDAVKEIFTEAFENKNVVVTGYPRNDVLFNADLIIQDHSDLLQRQKFDKIILYAPTFRDNQESVSPFSNEIEHYNKKLAEKNYLFVVKKHPWEKNFVVPDHLSNVLDVGDKVDDIQELMPHIDILITDYSSSFYDFMLLNRTVIFYPYDFDEYIKNCRGIYFDYFDELQGPFAKNESELFDLILDLEWKEEAEYIEKYKRVLDKYNKFKDGQSAERLLNYLFVKK